jgi:hypothetical protein
MPRPANIDLITLNVTLQYTILQWQKNHFCSITSDIWESQAERELINTFYRYYIPRKKIGNKRNFCLQAIRNARSLGDIPIDWNL